MPKSKLHPMFARLISAICIAIVCILLVAGLAPFHAPKNQVAWLQGQNGLQFKRPASIVSTGAFPVKAGGESSGETLEILLRRSSVHSTNAILAFDGPSGAGAGFVVRQYKDALAVRQPYIDDRGVLQVAWPTAMDVFSGDSPVLVTIVLGERETLIYLNGVLKETFPIKGTSVDTLTGRMVLGNSIEVSDSWPGQVLGLAMYHTQLTSAQVANHYEGWMEKGNPRIFNSQAAFAVYGFNERQGNIVHNILDSATDLLIPGRYFLLHPRLFSSLKQDYKPTWQYWEDVGVNITGFIPFGLFAAIYFSRVRETRWPLAATIICGFLISFTIEGLQFFLPTRSSGCTDLITNTFGTVIGVMVYRSSLVTRWLDEFAATTPASETSERNLRSMVSSSHASKEATLTA